MDTLHRGRIKAVLYPCRIFCFILLICLLLFPQKPETIVLRVILNSAIKGDFFVLQTEEKDILFPLVHLRGFGFKDLSDKARLIDDHASLKSLFPLLTFELDELAATLIMTAEPELFEDHIFDLKASPPEETAFLEENSAFLNYSLNLNAGDGSSSTAFSLPLEMGMRLSNFLFYSSFSYAKSQSYDQFFRHMTHVSRDFPKKMIRMVMGDYPATAGEYGGAGILGGVNFSKNFTLQPYMTRYPGMEFSGVARTPSEVEIYINDRLIRTEKLSPGEFHFRDLSIFGAGEATLVIKDAFGREEIFTNPYFISSRLLKPGLDSFSYSLGFKRQPIGMNNQKYGNLTFVGFHRKGFTKQFTGGIGIEADKSMINLRTTATFVPGKWGEMSASLTMSRKHGKIGYGGGVNLFIPGRKGINLRLSAVGYSRDYSSLFSISRQNIKFGGILNIGYHHRNLGSISATYSIQDRYGSHARKSLALFFRRRLFMNGSLFLSFSKVWADISFYEAHVGLNFYLGGRKTVTVNSRLSEGVTRYNASFHKNPPIGIGTGYRVQVDGNRNSQAKGLSYTSELARFEYHGPYGIYTLDYRASAGRNSYSLRAAGSIAYIGHKFYMSRPISDSFVIVKVGDIQGAGIKFNNHKAGSTNKNGELIVPGLISYLSNRISLETDDVPLNYSIFETSRYATTFYRGGGLLEFDVKKFQAFEGRIFHMKNGQKEFLEFAFLEIDVGGEILSSVTGKDGEFYLENLAPGKYRVNIIRMKEKFYLDLIIPESKEIVVNLGDLLCEID
ncbi:MAG: fimbrial biogenesis outer membrane usher protein [Candidatus Aminicenantes bacterium]|nr:MAG: fimbrial biogenesis outer membrane usher protein [Candidatus Aminicenantes bacterium]